MVNGSHTIEDSEIKNRFLCRFKGSTLKLVNFTGTALKRAALTGSISTETPYDRTQKWAAAAHAHKDNFDGIYYVSRHLNDERAVAIFDRVQSKITDPTYQSLRDVPFGDFADLGIIQK